MRIIKFRGQRKDNKEWIYGYYYKSYCNGKLVSAIIEKFWLPKTHHTNAKQSSRTIEIIPGTAGQFTGLKDKNGKEIYEGDIIQFHYNSKEEQEQGLGTLFKAKVVWNDFIIKGDLDNDRRLVGFCIKFFDEESDYTDFPKIPVEVIGNIWENPEKI